MTETIGCTLFFVKHPTPGRVKTRLADEMGDQAAAELYSNFVLDMLDGLRRQPGELRICFDPDSVAGEAKPAVKEWLGPELHYWQQEGNGLGERMHNAFQRAFDAGFERVALLGSDVPDFPSTVVGKALEALYLRDAVVGPALDGGYYLIGFRSKAYLPEVFQGIEWGGPDVFAATRAKMEAAGLEASVLPEWNDVDEMRDLNVLFRLNKNSSFRHSRTYRMLELYEDQLRELDLDMPRRDFVRATPDGEIIS
jgi:hypothetical protein